MKRPSLQRQLLGQFFSVVARIYLGFVSKSDRREYILSLHRVQKSP